jgi:transposase
MKSKKVYQLKQIKTKLMIYQILTTTKKKKKKMINKNNNNNNRNNQLIPQHLNWNNKIKKQILTVIMINKKVSLIESHVKQQKKKKRMFKSIVSFS